MLSNVIFPLNVVVVTAKRHYRYRGIIFTVPPRYYREIFPIPVAVITAVLPLSPLPCHPLQVSIESLRIWEWVPLHATSGLAR